MTQATALPEIEWAGPPPERSGRTNTRWGRRVDMLKERPNEWARFGGLAATGTTTASKRLAVRYPEVEFAGRTIDGKGYIYARFVGES